PRPPPLQLRQLPQLRDRRRTTWNPIRRRSTRSWPRNLRRARIDGLPKAGPGRRACEQAGRRPEGNRRMTAQEIVFLFLAAIGGFGAIRLVTSRNVVHAALYLVVTLAMVDGTYLVVAAELIAWVQVLIYVGDSIELVLFSLMLTM